MLQPANVVMVNAPRRIKFFEMDPPLIGYVASPFDEANATCSPWNMYAAYQDTLTNKYPFDQGGSISAYQFRGGNLLPSRFVVPIHIPSQFWNGAVFQINATQFPTGVPFWNYTNGACLSDSSTLAEYANPIFTNGVRHNPFHDCAYLLRQYCFAQLLTLSLTTTSAQLSFDYPSGGTIVA